jgi:hypothetical protein
LDPCIPTKVPTAINQHGRSQGTKTNFAAKRLLGSADVVAAERRRSLEIDGRHYAIWEKRGGINSTGAGLAVLLARRFLLHPVNQQKETAHRQNPRNNPD